MRPLLFALALAFAPPALAGPSAADLVRAYPDQFAAIEGNDLVWRDGTKMPISDGIPEKDFDTLLDHPDIDDMFAMPYVAGPPAAEPGLDQDPGRIRYEPLFTKMYGDCETGGVDPHLRSVAWLKGKVRFTTVNGAADALEKVVADLRQLPPEMTRYLVPSAGTYNCRRIAGTDRRSMHAYGAAIDISTASADYWLWAKPVDGRYPYRNRIPFAIVEAFERHGFVWGGKWYHYDTMHFEYRPELVPAAAR
ncbi:MAG: M15 family metallopeptidase [Rhizobiales bacterium]|nr:M15 family metallopeptidase [Hyphomicrobiales bacterium]